MKEELCKFRTQEQFGVVCNNGDYVVFQCRMLKPETNVNINPSACVLTSVGVWLSGVCGLLMRVCFLRHFSGLAAYKLVLILSCPFELYLILLLHCLAVDLPFIPCFVFLIARPFPETFACVFNPTFSLLLWFLPSSLRFSESVLPFLPPLCRLAFRPCLRCTQRLEWREEERGDAAVSCRGFY